MLDYVVRYRKYYPADSRQEVWCEIPMNEGYAMIAGGMLYDGWLQFSGMTIADGGYIRQEAQKIIKQKP